MHASSAGPSVYRCRTRRLVFDEVTLVVIVVVIVLEIVSSETNASGSVPDVFWYPPAQGLLSLYATH